MKKDANKSSLAEFICVFLKDTADLFLSVSDHLPRLDKDDNVFTVHEELPDAFIISVDNTVSALRKVKVLLAPHS